MLKHLNKSVFLLQGLQYLLRVILDISLRYYEFK